MIKDGEDISEKHSLLEKKAFYDNTLAHFSRSERRLINPHYFKVDISEELRATKISILERINREIAALKLD